MCRRGLTLLEVIGIIVLILLLLALVLPGTRGPRELSKRAVCSVNLRGISQSLHIYAYDNGSEGDYPLPPLTQFARNYDPADPNNGGGVNFINAMGRDYTQPVSGNADRPGPLMVSHSVSRSPFMLIVTQSCTPRQFICPDDAVAIEDDLRNSRTGGGVQAAQPGINRFDFKGFTSTSYGFQSQFSAAMTQTAGRDSHMVIAADRGPAFTSGPPRADGSTPDALRSGFIGKLMFADGTGGDPQRVLARPNDDWRPFNSPNHIGEGQNVLYADAHVEFAKKPIVGVHGDNIYTWADDDSQLAHLVGVWPANDKGPRCVTDSLILP